MNSLINSVIIFYISSKDNSLIKALIQDTDDVFKILLITVPLVIQTFLYRKTQSLEDRFIFTRNSQ
mgnify:CR=1 FL=1